VIKDDDERQSPPKPIPKESLVDSSTTDDASALKADIKPNLKPTVIDTAFSGLSFEAKEPPTVTNDNVTNDVAPLPPAGDVDETILVNGGLLYHSIDTLREVLSAPFLFPLTLVFLLLFLFWLIRETNRGKTEISPLPMLSLVSDIASAQIL
jgi:hypothetical protein